MEKPEDGMKTEVEKIKVRGFLTRDKGGFRRRRAFAICSCVVIVAYKRAKMGCAPRQESALVQSFCGTKNTTTTTHTQSLSLLPLFTVCR